MNCVDQVAQTQDREAMLRSSLERIIQLYTDKSHFIYELLQNAEDAAARKVKFIQYSDRLEVLHDGKPFTVSNLRSLCDIGKSDKTEDLNQIGEFGVGFKSVFGICDKVRLYSTPENYSGKEMSEWESFAAEIHDFTRPINIEQKKVQKGYTTRFVFPYNIGFSFSGFRTVEDLNRAISSRLRNLGITTLLFMRNLESIEYEIRVEEETLSGTYLLDKKKINDHCQLVSAFGETGNKEEDISYLKFTKTIDKTVANRTVDIAFPVTIDENGVYTFREAENPYVSVYFPTETESKLKFIVQGPYRTTPNRSSVPSDDPENIELSKLTAELLKESIRELGVKRLINLSFLKILPIDERAFGTSGLFKILYRTVRDQLFVEQLIPCRNGGYVSAECARIARNQRLPGIFDDKLLSSLIKKGYEVKWLSTELTETSDQYRVLYEYMTRVLKITVVRPEDLRTLLDNNPLFLTMRDNEWLVRMYKMFESIPNLFSKVSQGSNMLTINFVKTSDGSFVAPYRRDSEGNYLPNVFLPGQKKYTNLDIVFVDNYVYSQCKHFFKAILGLQAPKDYDLFIEDFKNRSISRNKQGDDEHINDIKSLLYYLNSSDYGNDIIKIIRGYLKLVCYLNGNRVYANPYKALVLLPKTKNNISIEAYYRGIVDNTYVDLDYYLDRGISFEDLDKLGVKNSILENENEISGNYHSDNPGRRLRWHSYGDFRWKLSIHKIYEVLTYISQNPNFPDSMAKSQTIFKLLQENESALEGEVHIDGSKSDEKDAFSDIVNRLRCGEMHSPPYSSCDVRWLYTESGELVAASSITKNDLNKSLYGNPKPDSALYRILGFKKDASEQLKDIVRDYDQLSQEKKQSFFELELQRRYGISDEYLQAQLSKDFIEQDDDTVPYAAKYEFPISRVRNWDSLRKHTIEIFAFARPVQYEYLQRRVRTSNQYTSKTYLRGHYKVENTYTYACQMCHKFFGDTDACQIENNPKDELEPLHLLLCPNCSRRFKSLRGDVSTYNRFMSRLSSITQEDIERTDTVKIDFKDYEIWFTQTHIAEISEILRLRESVEKENPNPASDESWNRNNPSRSIHAEKTAHFSESAPVSANELKPKGIDFTQCVGKSIMHRMFGSGIVDDCDDAYITINFTEGRRAGDSVKLDIKTCIENDYLELIG